MMFGYAYMASITEAIEQWADAVEKSDTKAFHHRGANLRSAVERSLFFRLVNNLELQSLFDAANGQKKIRLTVNARSGAVGPGSAGDLDGNNIDFAIARPNMGRWLRSRIGNYLRMGRAPYRATGLRDQANFLFFAIHPKFVDFLAPVAETLGADYAFLSVTDDAERHAISRKLPSIRLCTAYSAQPLPKSILEQFPDLYGYFDRIGDMMDDIRPKVVIVPEGNAPTYELALRAGLQRNISTICVQHGAPAYTNPGFRKWNFKDVFVWGEAFIEPYARYNSGQSFSVTGTPAALPARRPLSRAPIRCIAFFLQKGATIHRDEEWSDLLTLITSAARAFPDVNIVIRDHPTQPPMSEAEIRAVGSHTNLRYMPPSRYSLNEVLTESDVVIAMGSTTLLEAVQAGAIPLIFGTIYPKDFPDLVKEFAAVTAPDSASAQSAIAKIIADDSFRMDLRRAGERIRPSLFAASGAEGIKNIARALAAYR